MKNGTAKSLLSGGVGLGLGFLLARLAGIGNENKIDRNDPVIVLTRVGGELQIEVNPSIVTRAANEALTWRVVNFSGAKVRVSLEQWSDEQGESVDAAVDADPDSNDKQQPPQDQLSRKVPSGKTRKIRGKARKPREIEGQTLDEELVAYVVRVDNITGPDPIVRLVP